MAAVQSRWRFLSAQMNLLSPHHVSVWPAGDKCYVCCFTSYLYNLVIVVVLQSLVFMIYGPVVRTCMKVYIVRSKSMILSDLCINKISRRTATTTRKLIHIVISNFAGVDGIIYANDNERRRAREDEKTPERQQHTRQQESNKRARGVAYSESLPELSSELESEEWSLSAPCAAAGACEMAEAAAAPPFSKSAMRSSRTRIFSASTSSSMLFRLRPPVPVPLPVLARLAGGARFGRMTKL